MLTEDRPKISATLTNVQAATAKMMPLLDNLKTTMDQANLTLSHLDAILVENRPDIREVVVQLKGTLVQASSLMEQIKNLTDRDADNLDQILLNLRVTTENMKELTDTLKSKPSMLIRGNSGKDRKPGGN